MCGTGCRLENRRYDCRKFKLLFVLMRINGRGYLFGVFCGGSVCFECEFEGKGRMLCFVLLVFVLIYSYSVF